MGAELARVAQQGYPATIPGPAQGDDRVRFRGLPRFVDEQEAKARRPVWLSLITSLP